MAAVPPHVRQPNPAAHASTSQHPFAEGHAAGTGGSAPSAATARSDSGGPGKPKDDAVTGAPHRSPNDPGDRPSKGPYSNPTPEPPKEAVKEEAGTVLSGGKIEASEATTSVPPPPTPPSAHAEPDAGVATTAPGPTDQAHPEHAHAHALATLLIPGSRKRVPRHPFHTYQFVKTLEGAGIDLDSARVLMESVRGLLVGRAERANEKMLGKEENDNESYLFKAALSELRTEMSVRTRNDGIKLRGVTSAIRRSVDGLEQNIKEDVQVMKHDIEMDMNTRKAETRSDMKKFDLATEEINNKFTISLGELKTEIESAKWDATRRAISIIAVLVIAGIAISTFVMPKKKATPPPPPAAPKPTMMDQATNTPDDDLDDETALEGEVTRLLAERQRERRAALAAQGAKTSVPGKVIVPSKPRGKMVDGGVMVDTAVGDKPPSRMVDA